MTALRTFLLASLTFAPVPGVAQAQAVKIVLVGDSTVATEGGWGPGFCSTLKPGISCVDLAMNGRSSRSFVDEGLWEAALKEKGQYYFIQFGHNDQKDDPARHTDAETGYADNLRRYIRDARALGATPFIVSPLSRRTYRDGALADDGLKAYAMAAGRIATEQKVAFIDLFSISQALLGTMTQQQADAFDATTHPDAKAENASAAKPDRTHLNEKGKAVFGRMVADEVVRVRPKLGQSIAPAVETSGSLHEPARPPEVTVSHVAGSRLQTIQDAVDHAPSTGETIRIAPGTYREKIHIDKPNIHLVGLGKRPQDVILSWNDSASSAGGTGKSGSVSVNADGFAAENLTIENTWENEHQRSEEGSQAVALLLHSDRAVLDRVRLLGAQDTLYANSRICHENLPKDGSAPPTDVPECRASRQYFRDCYIEGHVDYIFGDAQAVFDGCELHSRHNPTVMLTAQSKHYPAEVSGFYFLHCRITGDNDGDKVVLGRPWRDFSTVVFYDTDVQQTIAPEGWSEWNGHLKTSTYREYKSRGPGVNGGHRAVASPELSVAEERGLTPGNLLAGLDGWSTDSDILRLRRIAASR